MTVTRAGTTPTPFGFVGKAQRQSDSDSGLQLLEHRYYDSNIMIPIKEKALRVRRQKTESEIYPFYWLLGIRIDPDNDEPDFFTIMVQEDAVTKPLLFDNQIIIFRNRNQKHAVLSLAGIHLPSPNHLGEHSFWLDFAEAFYLLHGETHDPSATLLNLINGISDILPALGIELPKEYKDILNQFANHLTFAQEFGEFIEQSHIARKELRDGLIWCLGAIFATCKIVV